MYYYLEGDITILGQNLAVVDIGGAGYACMTTMNTLSRLETGKKARLYTYCHIKEDAFDLYGFFALSEKRCFEQLLSVTGVGPKAALSILSSATPESLALAIVGDDETALTVAPGIGKKLAQRIILELKDKVSKELGGVIPGGFAPSGYSDAAGIAPAGQARAGGAAGQPGAGQPGAGQPGAKQRDAAAALAVLGYSRGEISAAMRNIDANDMTVEEIVREVLRLSVK